MIRFRTPKFWECRNIYSNILLPISFLYSFLSFIKSKLISPYKSSIFIICVGNLTLGGAGKTPTSIAISKLIESKSLAFLSRGYGGCNRFPRKVKTHDNASRVGDEALILAKYGTVYIAPKKKDAILLAEQNNIKILISDDGLQNKSIYYNYKILVIDGEYGLGNGRVFPAGPLRERKCDYDLAVIIGEDKFNLSSKFKRAIKAKYKLITQEIDFKGKYVAFAAIARPSKFYNSLNELNINVVDRYDYPDHYNYRESDILKLIEIAKNNDALLITTEKDIVKIDKAYHQYIKTVYIELIFDECEKLEKLLYEKTKKHL